MTKKDSTASCCSWEKKKIDFSKHIYSIYFPIVMVLFPDLVILSMTHVTQ